MDVVKDGEARRGWLPKDWAIGLKKRPKRRTRLINLEGCAHTIVLTCDHPIETSTIGFVVIL
jgi:hypothetical protein